MTRETLPEDAGKRDCDQRRHDKTQRAAATLQVLEPADGASENHIEILVAALLSDNSDQVRWESVAAATYFTPC